MHHKSISVKNIIGLKPRMFSPANLSMSTIVSSVSLNGLEYHLRWIKLKNNPGDMHRFLEHRLYVPLAADQVAFGNGRHLLL